MNTHYIEMIERLGLDHASTPVLVETGTHRGAGAEAWATIFNKVHTIELSHTLYSYCKNTYDFSNVNFIHGASTDVLGQLVQSIEDKYVLFLDAHGSGGDTTFDERVGRFGSPVLEEIECVKVNPPEYILVDDLSDFDSIESYPTVQEIIEKVSELGEYSASKYFCKVFSKGVLVFFRDSDDK